VIPIQTRFTLDINPPINNKLNNKVNPCNLQLIVKEIYFGIIFFIDEKLENLIIFFNEKKKEAKTTICRFLG
jgi:hypothetical protein